MVYIGTLIGGNIVIGSGGSSGHPETRFTLQGGTVETYDITGTLDQQWMIDNGYFDYDLMEWSKIITQSDIGNTVTSIGHEAFYGCSSLTSIAIPDIVTSIGQYAFYECRGLTNVTLPNSITSISGQMFYGCSGLTSVIIPNNVTSIGNGAFSDCSGLTSATIPDSVTSIGEYAFDSCNGLTSVTITANGGNAASVKQMMIDAGVDENITWNMPN